MFNNFQLHILYNYVSRLSHAITKYHYYYIFNIYIKILYFTVIYKQR